MTKSQYSSGGADSLWECACALYRAPGVAAACLQAQDQYQQNINHLLCCCWLGLRGQGLDYSLIAAAPAALNWHQHFVLPVRALRRQAKAWPVDETLYQQWLALELALERQELDYLEQALAPSMKPLMKSAPGKQTSGPDLVRANWLAYWQQQGLTNQLTTPLLELLQPLLQACQQPGQQGGTADQ